MTITVMTLLTALLTLVFLGVLAVALIKLNPVLERIGGTPTSTLAKLRFGLRAIERETSHLPGQVGRINIGLVALADGLTEVDRRLERTKAALEAQGR
ncbi:MAG TPA: hypothetical protein VFZ01_12085 [Geminicoccaceae bacterium]